MTAGRTLSLARYYNEGIALLNKHEWLAERFEANRTHLQAMAYRMLGSLSEADDAVQKSWLRLSRSDRSSVENLGGWLTTVVARICLDMPRSRNSQHEESLEASASEPITSSEASCTCSTSRASAGSPSQNTALATVMREYSAIHNQVGLVVLEK